MESFPRREWQPAFYPKISDDIPDSHRKGGETQSVSCADRLRQEGRTCKNAATDDSRQNQAKEDSREREHCLLSF